MSDRSRPDQLLEDAFDRALRAGDARTSAQIAALIESRLGTRAVYDAMSVVLAQLGSAWEQGRGTILAERVASQACLSVCERIWARCPEPTRTGLVVLATPPAERHTLALRALGHQLQKAGRRVRVVEDLPVADLCEAVACEGTSALVLSLHLPLSLAAVRRLVGPVRAAAPQLFVVLGGPGVPQGAAAVADLVTDDPQEVVLALAGHESCLTVREREVLAAVADGLTTQEIASRLCLSSSTVKTHLDHILTKTGTEHRAAAVARAMREGWLR